MEKRSCHRIRDLVALTAIQGLSQNEIGCARISVMARSKSAPFKGRIQKRKTNYLQIIISSLQRTAGPYKSARRRHSDTYSITSSASTRMLAGRSRPRDLAVLRLMTNFNLVGCWTGRSGGLVPLKILSA
jgi:hypothetical protein